MTNPQHQPTAGGLQDALKLLITDAVEASHISTYEVDMTSYHTVSKSGVETIFADARAAAETEPGSIEPRVFNAALKAAAEAVAHSRIPSNYDVMRKAVMSIPDHLVWMAARHAASDLFVTIPAKPGTSGDRRLLSKMRAAAVRAAKTRFRQDDCAQAVRAATDNTRDIADKVVRMTSGIVLIGMSSHAATAAVFGSAIRGVLPADLANAVMETCEDLPNVARRHGDPVTGFVAALSTMIEDNTLNRRKYQTAIRGANELCRGEAITQTVNMIVENVFEAVYTALVASAYVASDGATFKADYENAVAKAFKVSSDQIRLAKMGSTIGNIPQDYVGVAPEEAFQTMQQNLSDTFELMFCSEEELAHRRRIIDALNADYKTVASDGSMDGIIAMYKMAYRAGYEKAQATAARDQGGSKLQK